MLIPPFCPYSECPNHTALPFRKRWYHIAGRYETKVSGTVIRFKCLACGKTFSEQAFRTNRFFSHVKLNWSQMIVWARMTGTLDKHEGVYRPKYVWM